MYAVKAIISPVRRMRLDDVMLYGCEAYVPVLSRDLCPLAPSIVEAYCGLNEGSSVSKIRGSIITVKPMMMAAVVYAKNFVFMFCPCLFRSYCSCVVGFF